jgi:hypothetical protein
LDTGEEPLAGQRLPDGVRPVPETSAPFVLDLDPEPGHLDVDPGPRSGVPEWLHARSPGLPLNEPWDFRNAISFALSTHGSRLSPSTGSLLFIDFMNERGNLTAQKTGTGNAASTSMYTVADNVGYQKGGLGLSMTSRYAGAETLEVNAACVRGVKLPK